MTDFNNTTENNKHLRPVCKNEPDLTLDEFISILEREYNRGMYTAKYSKFDEGYAYAMKICIMLAKSIKE